MTESRQELISWINELLSLSIEKVEECGKGAIYCQVFDTIWRDVPMSKLNFSATAEYQYLNNFKVLQSVFTKHKVDRDIDVPRLVKCKFQDNLEFLQWTKRFWDANYVDDGTPYDPVKRRSAKASGPGAGRPSIVGGSIGAAPKLRRPAPQPAVSSPTRPKPPTSRPSAAPAARRTAVPSGGSSTKPAVAATRKSSAATAHAIRPTAKAAAAAAKSAAPGTTKPLALNGSRAGSRASSVASQRIQERQQQLENEVAELLERNEELEANNLELMEGLETSDQERNFYFDKLRDIEILIQDLNGQIAQRENTNDAFSMDFVDLVKDIQSTLYATVDGFEIPGPEEGEEGYLPEEEEDAEEVETF